MENLQPSNYLPVQAYEMPATAYEQMLLLMQNELGWSSEAEQILATSMMSCPKDTAEDSA